MNDYVHIEAADLRRPNARFTTERQGYQVLTPFGKLGYSPYSVTPQTVDDFLNVILRDPDLTNWYPRDEVVDALRLHVCNTPYDFSDAAAPLDVFASFRGYKWNVGSPWPPGIELVQFVVIHDAVRQCRQLCPGDGDRHTEVRGSDSAALVFARTVQAGEVDRNGIS